MQKNNDNESENSPILKIANSKIWCAHTCISKNLETTELSWLKPLPNTHIRCISWACWKSLAQAEASTFYFMLPISENFVDSQLWWLNWDIISQTAGIIQLYIWAPEQDIYFITMLFVLLCLSFTASWESI